MYLVEVLYPLLENEGAIALLGTHPREMKTYFHGKAMSKLILKYLIDFSRVTQMCKTRHKTRSLSIPFFCHFISVHYPWNGI